MKYIAAIEIGSSRIKGIVASVDDTAAITVLAVEELDSGETVRYGRVQNAREVSLRVNEIIQRLENSPKVAPGRISAVFVANGVRLPRLLPKPPSSSAARPKSPIRPSSGCTRRPAITSPPTARCWQ